MEHDSGNPNKDVEVVSCGEKETAKERGKEVRILFFSFDEVKTKSDAVDRELVAATVRAVPVLRLVVGAGGEVGVVVKGVASHVGVVAVG